MARVQGVKKNAQKCIYSDFFKRDAKLDRSLPTLGVNHKELKNVLPELSHLQKNILPSGTK